LERSEIFGFANAMPLQKLFCESVHGCGVGAPAKGISAFTMRLAGANVMVGSGASLYIFE
jgi:hypothetical protein